MPGRSMNVMNDASLGEFAAAIDQALSDAETKGVVITSGKPAFIAGADLDWLEAMLAGTAGETEEAAGPQSVRPVHGRSSPVPADRDRQETLCRGDQRYGTRRRVRDLPRLPSPHRDRRPARPARFARDQGRALSGVRRHAALPAHAGSARSLAGAARGDEHVPGAGDRARPRRRGGTRSRARRARQRLDPLGLGRGSRQALGQAGFCRSGCRPAHARRGAGLLGGECDAAGEDLRQLPGARRDPVGRLSRHAGADRHRAADRSQGLRQAGARSSRPQHGAHPVHQLAAGQQIWRAGRPRWRASASRGSGCSAPG